MNLVLLAALLAGGSLLVSIAVLFVVWRSLRSIRRSEEAGYERLEILREQQERLKLMDQERSAMKEETERLRSASDEERLLELPASAEPEQPSESEGRRLWEGSSVADALAEANLGGGRRAAYTSKGDRSAPTNKPVIGNLYDMEQQHKMHGGAYQQCAPTKDGDVTLLRLTPEHDPDAPGVVDWEASDDPKVRQIQEQTKQKPLPVYVRRQGNGWEYMGRFRVAHVATDGPTLARRRERSGHPVSYAIHLERS